MISYDSCFRYRYKLLEYRELHNFFNPHPHKVNYNAIHISEALARPPRKMAIAEPIFMRFEANEPEIHLVQESF